MNIKVIIPALNEAEAIAMVIADLPKNMVNEVVVVDNGSTDNTSEVAKKAGATVLHEANKGYGNACLKGIAYLRSIADKEIIDIVVFLDADYSDYPNELPLVVAPIINNNCDMVIGSRINANLEQGAMTIPQRFGNWLSAVLLKYLYGANFTDLGPFRAIKWEALLALNMEDENFGWTVEMQAKAAKQGLKCEEVSVSYRKRGGGKSKVSGTVKGTFLAGYKILYTLYKLR